jgi:hypothetical protein
MEITHEDIQSLVLVIGNSVQIIQWVVGLATTVLVGLVGATYTLTFRMIGKRIDAVIETAVAAQKEVVSARQTVNDMTVQCGQMRAACREDLLGRFLEKGEIRAMESEFKILVNTMVAQLQSTIKEDRTLLITKLDEIKAVHTHFQDEVWDALHGHKHAENGTTIRQPSVRG